MIEPKNYCRQIVRQYSEDFVSISRREKLSEIESGSLEIIRANLSLMPKAKKFIVPYGGYSCEDRDLRALLNVQDLHLPFSVIALEYDREFLDIKLGDGWASTKSVVLATEIDGRILILPSAWSDQKRLWAWFSPAVIALDEWDKSKGSAGIPFGLANTSVSRFLTSEMGYGQRDIAKDYGNELWAVMSFLNALACSNVSASLSVQARPMKKRSSSPIPFDDYWVLELRNHNGRKVERGGSHRSPREHVRRGHIRRLSDGRHIWVNAAVVAANRGAGRITKDYSLQAFGPEAA